MEVWETRQKLHFIIIGNKSQSRTLEKKKDGRKKLSTHSPKGFETATKSTKQTKRDLIVGNSVAAKADGKKRKNACACVHMHFWHISQWSKKERRRGKKPPFWGFAFIQASKSYSIPPLPFSRVWAPRRWKHRTKFIFFFFVFVPMPPFLLISFEKGREKLIISYNASFVIIMRPLKECAICFNFSSSPYFSTSILQSIGFNYCWIVLESFLPQPPQVWCYFCLFSKWWHSKPHSETAIQQLIILFLQIQKEEHILRSANNDKLSGFMSRVVKKKVFFELKTTDNKMLCLIGIHTCVVHNSLWTHFYYYFRVYNHSVVGFNPPIIFSFSFRHNSSLAKGRRWCH